MFKDMFGIVFCEFEVVLKGEIRIMFCKNDIFLVPIFMMPCHVMEFQFFSSLNPLDLSKVNGGFNQLSGVNGIIII